MKIKVEVYQDYEKGVLLEDYVCGVETKDWKGLVEFILQEKGLKPESISDEIVIEVYGTRCYCMFEFPDDREYEIPDDLGDFSAIIRTADDKVLAHFNGVEVLEVEGQTRQQTEKLESNWKEFLIKVKGEKFADVIAERLKQIQEDTEFSM